MINNILLKANPNSYTNHQVYAIDINVNKSKAKSFQITWHRIGRKLISKANKKDLDFINCAVTYRKMEIYKNYPLVHGIIVFSENKPSNNINSIHLLIKNKIYYIFPISYQFLNTLHPNIEKLFIPGRIYNEKVFVNKLNINTNLSEFIFSWNVKWNSSNKINRFIKNWLDSKKSIQDHEILDSSESDNFPETPQDQSSRCTIS